MLKVSIIIILIYSCLLVKSQGFNEQMSFNREIIYDYIFFNDSTQLNAPSNQKMSLLLNDSLSLFQLTSRYSRDSTLIHDKKSISAKVFGIISPISNSNYRIFKTKNKIITVESIKGFDIKLTNDFQVYEEENIDPSLWNIYQDTLTINNLLCQKASINWKGRTWICWFSPEIPIFEGPYKFSGLPGLIVKMQDTKGFFTFELQAVKEVNKYYNPNIRRDIIYNHISKEEFFKQKKSFLKNMYEIAISEGIEPDESSKKNAVRFGKENNNWIELYP
ncbi:GLPGLI family protein [Sphingobacterium sp. HJSM2_6]|uniref:GLPGLI family protein n=1 Tax=Sphingobacterium sp. HJSM2_6 TaxID=3366264 RepID=UPI003BC0051F